MSISWMKLYDKRFDFFSSQAQVLRVVVLHLISTHIVAANILNPTYSGCLISVQTLLPKTMYITAMLQLRVAF